MKLLLAFLLSLCQIHTERVITGLDEPLFVTNSGESGKLFILEQCGTIQLFEDDALTTYLNISSRVTCDGERGLLGLAFHPDFLNNNFFYVYYTDNGGDTVVSRFTQNGSGLADPSSEVELLTFAQQNNRHNAGWIGFGPNDGYLYISTGDGASGACDSENDAQDIESFLGKILRIDINTIPYSVPADNPFVDQPGLDEIWVYGLRNPWRCSFDDVTGDLYIGDVGLHAWEEVNILPDGVSGLNYGWDCMEGDHCSTDSGCGSNQGCVCFDPSLTGPSHEYDHSVGAFIIGGEVYNGCSIDGFQGTYFFTAGFDVWSFRYEGGIITELTDRSTELTPTTGSLGSIASFGTDSDGEIYICNLNGGEVYKIFPDIEEIGDQCLFCDADEDGDVDLADYSAFQLGFTGAK